jgi:hypothetical protein
LLPSGPGGIQRELVVYDFPYANIGLFIECAKEMVEPRSKWNNNL